MHQLKLFGKYIPLSKSKHKPDRYLLRSLAENEGERREPRLASKPPAVKATFGVTSISCGVWDHDGNDAVFVEYFRLERKGNVTFDENTIVASFPYPLNNLSRLEAHFDYQYLHGPIYTGALSNPTITITSMFAPRLYDKTDVDDTASVDTIMALLTTMLRSLDFNDKKKSNVRLDGFGGESDAVVSTCFTYRLNLATPTDTQLLPLLDKKRRIPKLEAHVTSTAQLVVPYDDSMAEILVSLMHCGLPYGLKFQLQALVWNGTLLPSKVSSLLPKVRELYKRQGYDHTVHAIQWLARSVQYPCPEMERLETDVEVLGHRLAEFAEAAELDDTYVKQTRKHSQNGTDVYRATVTPLGIYLYGPYWESSNRVLRAYPDHNEYFMRVDFLEETGDPIRFDQNASLDRIFNHRFKTLMQKGFKIAGRHFDFLGFSHSSLRSQSCWFMAGFTIKTGERLEAKTVIRKLGDFSHIMTPAKCAARIGQALSETVPSIEVSPEAVNIVGDVKAGGRVFSDGVGTISKSLIMKIWESYALGAKVKPTVLQIRFAGAKGMISLNSSLTGDVLMLRDSMVKFYGSNAWNIELCGSGIKPLPFRLNRQIIKILEDLGVSPESFLELQEEEVSQLQITARSPGLAVPFLEKSHLATSAMIPDLIRTINRLGLGFRRDDFLRHMIELAVLVKLQEIKYRSRILVKSGLTLHGVMDETGFLKEGEVYCPTINDDTGRREVLVAENVVVTRAPALHPGDVQLVNAIDVPNDSILNDLHNCVVFSQQGNRDLPSKLSGGDLDGDLYNVIYDKRLLPGRSKIVDAADYPRVEPKSLDRPVESTDIIDFFIEFMKQDQLGRIATMHQSTADQAENGVFDNDCILLAHLHSTAVDYSKTGIPVDVTLFPRNNRVRPDFMAPGPRVEIKESMKVALDAVENNPDNHQNYYSYYRSDKVLGRLYRAIDEQGFLKSLEDVPQDDISSENVFGSLWQYVQRETRGSLWEHCVASAQHIKDIYEDNVYQLLSQYSSTPWASTITELELFIGDIVQKTHGQTKRQREASKNMREEYERLVEFTVSQIQNKSNERAEALERSLACMSIGVEGAVGKGAYKRGGLRPLFSFRWIAASVCLKEIDRLKLGRVSYFP